MIMKLNRNKYSALALATILSLSIVAIMNVYGQGTTTAPGFLSKEFQKIPPSEANKSPLTTQPPPGEITSTFNVVELKERPDGGVDAKSAPPKHGKGSPEMVKKGLVEDTQKALAPIVTAQKGKPLKVEVINDDTGKMQRLEITNAKDPKLGNALNNAIKIPPQAEWPTGSFCWPHVHLTVHPHYWWQVTWIHIHTGLHWHCI